MDVKANTAAAVSALKSAAAAGADILLLPECFLTGYALPIDNSAAITPDCGAVQLLRRTAARCGTGVVATSLMKGAKKPRNSAIVIGRGGEVLMRYDKVHTCDFSDEACLESGGEFRVCDYGRVKIGVMICYDREYPESARVLMLRGAELILVPNDCGSMAPRLRALSVRAYENMVGIAMANPPGKQAGRSCAFSPICWDENGGECDNVLLTADEMSEGLFFADFDLERLKKYRKSEMMGNTFRKTEAYGPLLSAKIGPPFVRKRGDEK